MSNHSVGHAINEITKGIYKRYLQGMLSQVQTRELIKLCFESSNYEDGNDYEGVECLENCVCGRCLEIVPKGEKLFSSYHIDEENICSTRICAICLDEIIIKKELNEQEVERIKEYEYESKGEFIDDEYNSYRHR